MLISTPAVFSLGDFVQTRTGTEYVYLVRSITYHMGGAITYSLSLGGELIDCYQDEIIPVMDSDGKRMNVAEAGERDVCHIPRGDEEEEAEE